MAYISEGEDELLRQQGMSGGGDSAPATRAPTKSGSWTNLNKYMVGSDSVAGKLTEANNSGIGALTTAANTSGTNAANVANMYNNPENYTNEQYTAATSSNAPVDTINTQADTLTSNVNKLGTTEGRFDLLKNIQKPDATTGISKLNQYLASRGSGADILNEYAQKTPEQIAKLKAQYGENIGKISSTTANVDKEFNDLMTKYSSDQAQRQKEKDADFIQGGGLNKYEYMTPAQISRLRALAKLKNSDIVDYANEGGASTMPVIPV